MKKNFLTIGFLVVLFLSSCTPKIKRVAVDPTIPNKEVTEAEVPTTTDEKEEEVPIKEVPNEELNQVYLVASLSKTPCYGNCPVFEVRIFSDGKVEFVGRKNVNLIGQFQAHANQEFIEQIKSAARAINYMKLEDSYPKSGKKILDLPNTISYVRMDHKEKMIRNNHLAPNALRSFEKKLEAMINTLSYQKIN